VHHAAVRCYSAGYQEENKTKPDECRNIEKMESVYRADDCAQALCEFSRDLVWCSRVVFKRRWYASLCAML